MSNYINDDPEGLELLHVLQYLNNTWREDAQGVVYVFKYQYIDSGDWYFEMYDCNGETVGFGSSLQELENKEFLYNHELTNYFNI